MTWSHHAGGYSLFFNRDELHSRPQEHPPRRWNSRGVNVLAPLDDGGGGTWIAVNEHGLTAALLNNYACETKAHPRPRSRGAIPLLAAAFKSVGEAEGWARRAAFDSFKPFFLALVDGQKRSALVTWDGSSLSIAPDVGLPVTTSSFRPDDVVRSRVEQFQELAAGDEAASPELLEAFHRSKSPRGDAWSVLMCRADACTRSMIRIDVSPESVTMCHEPFRHGKGDAGRPTILRLPRVSSPVGGDTLAGRE